MNRVIIVALCVSQFVAGCKTQPVNEAGLYQRPGWFDRRMDRLEDWNTHHGYPIDKAKTVVYASLFVGGAIALLAGVAAFNGEFTKKPGQKSPYGDSLNQPTFN